MIRNYLIVLGFVFIGGAGFLLANKAPGLGGEDTIACTMEAKMCPDGSYVGRSGPKCEFTECPKAETPEGKVASLNQRILNNGVYITPLEVSEDSRCPEDVQCVWAGRVLLKARLERNDVTKEVIFSNSVVFEGKTTTLADVRPNNNTKKPINQSDYRFTFIVSGGASTIEQNGKITYINATSNNIVVDLPFPGAVTGKEFSVTGKARGTWYFEASFPIEVVDMDGKLITVGIAQAQDEWMTENFVPFIAPIRIPPGYTGPATLVLRKDNPSGLPEHDASISFPITIEY